MFYPYGNPFHDHLLPPNDDDSSSEIHISSSFPFFNTSHRSLFVNTNGDLTFLSALSSFTPSPFPYLQNTQIVAVYWGDIDTSKVGDIWYRETTDSVLLQKASSEIHTVFPQQSGFNASWIFVTTWSKVAFYGSNSIGQRMRNTFQCVLVTDGMHSFVIYNYYKIQWTSGTSNNGTNSAGFGSQVGFDAGDGVNYYVVNGSRTPMLNECDGQVCLHNGTCQDLDGLSTWRCNCVSGFTGTHCETDINECHSSPCQHHGNCLDLLNDYSCHCMAGFTGKDCQIDIDECQSSPCMNGATCRDKNNSYTCDCQQGYVGNNCQIDIDECQSNPCYNNATCIDRTPGWDCACLPGFTGNQCTIDINECHSFPCQHHGNCLDLLNDYRCHCMAGYTGNDCQIDIDECQSNPCMNGATCRDRNNSYTCDCQLGYFENNCQIDIDECQSNPCYNNAICIDRTPGWKCACLPGFTGNQCQIAINECNSNSCRNNGTCVDLINGYRCHCSNDSTGQHCEHRLDHCSSHPCLHDGSCINNYGGFKCECKDSWFGDICEERQTNDSEGCSVLEYSECSCFTQQSKQTKKSIKMLIGSIGCVIGLLFTILSYCAWMMLNQSKSDRKIYPHEATILQHEVFQESKNVKKSAQSSQRINKLHESRLRKQKQQKEHHNCFLDHSGFDFSKLYVNEDGSRKILKCRHQRIQNDI
ncbi:Protein eyes shut homolog,Neurogenic locus Notch protein,Neurogenic locus notch homolog protein 3,Protein eyes shut,Alpha-tectorin,Delta and Notch-like epidermal growth factor-related receptor,Protocadherin Fat 4,Delta-like protein C,Neurogenic locus notch homolog protein 1,Fibropellin-3,Sushi, von Willebrand factor type A, EGF and pentraxin domain-containing protein 1,Protein jagged-2,Neurogenic locus notch homolog protein 2,Protein crumbs homolog 1,Delta-like protein D,Fibropellin-1,Protein crumbs,Delta-|uniref:Sushi, nidogen and EGF-like domain-containing protein 1,Alpha-tectorin n=1 Tax=Mytilus coruscus TaxID=42192 RepID=A0A6J8CIU8_MYTCO|nr:Protein eyes shut homolog,Neurogenic locus Notch protein,Neurogenic locus notch homolog protein 3,Protein eyes shut,Alpha-tectorin,Delta and Notch-like epidermal growth factor-related receptor,Protocadherin Fat 4,Delta-like protein C,Neurogenic locus notch homolog protein 1,Fibropellin-3,Sushi, von Willebrand factor type A, EGF and pentraxin domain-containing protein 1,Protein jagged-2,Neurogenic locus notch homolog protein 2,Protein crumbs homolog 1,Delta-like protein D,Fibropellin-1,Protein cr